MGSEAACSKVTASGMWIRFSASIAMRSQSPPLACSPSAPPGLMCGSISTRRPTHSRPTPAPTEWTTPAMSPPGMRGMATGSPGMPWSTKMSR